MRTLVLICAFVGGICLLSRQACSLDNCKAVNCKQMKAWMTVTNQILSTTGTYGLRMTDPTDPTKTIPVVHVPPVDGAHSGRYIALAADAGIPTSQGVDYNRYQYNQPPVKDCLPAQNENGNSVLSVTFANAGDWDDCSLMAPANNWRQTQCLCIIDAGVQ